MKILMPVDGLDDAQLILGFVANFNWPPNSSFRVMHVIGSSHTGGEGAKKHKEAMSLVASIVDLVKKLTSQEDVMCQIKTGHPAFEIAESAREWEADMIVMGYRTKNDVAACIAGSVSSAVSAQAPCSVAVIRPPMSSRLIKDCGADEASTEPVEARVG